jgi:NAD(P)-dependent dehydrogenase (short-subunit alcohol dehydrogenase family)
MRSRLQLSIDSIKDTPAANIRTLTLDFSSLVAVRLAAAEVNAYPEPLHVRPVWRIDPLNEDLFKVLINNASAGISPSKVTVDNLEYQMATGHIGPFLLTNPLAVKFTASATPTYTPRVVFVSSVAHSFHQGIDFAALASPDPTKYKTMFEPYNETKSANVLTAIDLPKRSGGKIKAYSLHPGRASHPF